MSKTYGGRRRNARRPGIPRNYGRCCQRAVPFGSWPPFLRRSGTPVHGSDELRMSAVWGHQQAWPARTDLRAGFRGSGLGWASAARPRARLPAGTAGDPAPSRLRQRRPLGAFPQGRSVSASIPEPLKAATASRYRHEGRYEPMIQKPASIMRCGQTDPRHSAPANNRTGSIRLHRQTHFFQTLNVSVKIALIRSCSTRNMAAKAAPPTYTRVHTPPLTRIVRVPLNYHSTTTPPPPCKNAQGPRPDLRTKNGWGHQRPSWLA